MEAGLPGGGEGWEVGVAGEACGVTRKSGECDYLA